MAKSCPTICNPMDCIFDVLVYYTIFKYVIYLVFIYTYTHLWASQVALVVKNLPTNAMQKTQETQVQSPSQEDPLEKKVATCSSILAWKTPWTEELGGLQFMGSQRVRQDWARMNVHT